MNQFLKLEKTISMNFHLWKWSKSLKESLFITRYSSFNCLSNDGQYLSQALFYTFCRRIWRWVYGSLGLHFQEGLCEIHGVRKIEEWVKKHGGKKDDILLIYNSHCPYCVLCTYVTFFTFGCRGGQIRSNGCPGEHFRWHGHRGGSFWVTMDIDGGHFRWPWT